MIEKKKNGKRNVTPNQVPPLSYVPKSWGITEKIEIEKKKEKEKKRKEFRERIDKSITTIHKAERQAYKKVVGVGKGIKSSYSGAFGMGGIKSVNSLRYINVKEENNKRRKKKKMKVK